MDWKKKENLKFRTKVLLLYLLFVSSLPSSADFTLLFQPRQRQVKTIVSIKDKIFIGTGNGVFISEDSGKTWNDFSSETLQKNENGNSKINWIFLDEEKEKIYIATSFGAYGSDINNPNWKKIFNLQKTENFEINSIAIEKNKTYFSTNDGLWLCKNDNCIRFNQGLESDNFGNYIVNFLVVANKKNYLCTSNGLYLLKKDTWERIDSGFRANLDGNIFVKHLYIDSKNKFWVATGNGIYFSGDEGKTWEEKSDGVLRNKDGFISGNYLSEFNGKIYLSSDNGFYSYNETSWDELSSGLRSTEGNKKSYFHLLEKNMTFIATDEGLFVENYNEPIDFKSPITLKGKVQNDYAALEELEPSVIDVQKYALKFAALPKDSDYKRYRLQARMRNFFPNVGIDLNDTGNNLFYLQNDRGINSNISDGSEFDASKIIKSQNDNRNFKQLSVSWNSGQLLYDNEIKDLLSQARLTANIRENILDDVTRIYFQRRRLQLDNLISPPNEVYEKLKKELEIAELTGQLDSRTGGWFSKEILRRKDNYEG